MDSLGGFLFLSNPPWSLSFLLTCFWLLCGHRDQCTWPPGSRRDFFPERDLSLLVPTDPWCITHATSSLSVCFCPSCICCWWLCGWYSLWSVFQSRKMQDGCRSWASSLSHPSWWLSFHLMFTGADDLMWSSSTVSLSTPPSLGVVYLCHCFYSIIPWHSGPASHSFIKIPNGKWDSSTLFAFPMTSNYLEYFYCTLPKVSLWEVWRLNWGLPLMTSLYPVFFFFQCPKGFLLFLFRWWECHNFFLAYSVDFARLWSTWPYLTLLTCEAY